MNDRGRAIAVLQHARQILQDRLTQRVLEMTDEILEDAAGDSYSGEIDALHEQIGLRLTCVNALLSGLPPTELPHHVSPTAQVSTLDVGGAARLEGVPGYPALDTSSTSAGLDRVDQGPVTFQTFLKQVLAQDLDGAAESLALLLSVPPARGRQCAAVFHRRLVSEPDFFTRALCLRREIETGSVNGSLRLLDECFGLQGLESVSAMQALRSQLDNS